MNSVTLVYSCSREWCVCSYAHAWCMRAGERESACAREMEGTREKGRERDAITAARGSIHVVVAPSAARTQKLTFLIVQEGKSKLAALQAKYASSFDASISRWVVITSINPPTRQVQKICDIKGWNKVVVADKKSPDNWASEGCFFLSVQDQAELGYKIHDLIPYSRYERKMIGYLFAIELGAQTILGKIAPPTVLPAVCAAGVLC